MSFSTSQQANGPSGDDGYNKRVSVPGVSFRLSAMMKTDADVEAAAAAATVNRLVSAVALTAAFSSSSAPLFTTAPINSFLTSNGPSQSKSNRVGSVTVAEEMTSATSSPSPPRSTVSKGRPTTVTFGGDDLEETATGLPIAKSSTKSMHTQGDTGKVNSDERDGTTSSVARSPGASPSRRISTVELYANSGSASRSAAEGAVGSGVVEARAISNSTNPKPNPSLNVGAGNTQRHFSSATISASSSSAVSHITTHNKHVSSRDFPFSFPLSSSAGPPMIERKTINTSVESLGSRKARAGKGESGKLTVGEGRASGKKDEKKRSNNAEEPANLLFSSSSTETDEKGKRKEEPSSLITTTTIDSSQSNSQSASITRPHVRRFAIPITLVSIAETIHLRNVFEQCIEDNGAVVGGGGGVGSVMSFPSSPAVNNIVLPSSPEVGTQQPTTTTNPPKRSSKEVVDIVALAAGKLTVPNLSGGDGGALPRAGAFNQATGNDPLTVSGGVNHLLSGTNYSPNLASIGSGPNTMQGKSSLSHFRPLLLDAYHVSLLLHRARLTAVPPSSQITQIIAMVQLCHAHEGDQELSVGKEISVNMTKTRAEALMSEGLDDDGISTATTDVDLLSSSGGGKTLLLPKRRESSSSSRAVIAAATANANNNVSSRRFVQFEPKKYLTFEMFIQIVELCKRWESTSDREADACDDAFRLIAAHHEDIASGKAFLPPEEKGQGQVVRSPSSNGAEGATRKDTSTTTENAASAEALSSPPHIDEAVGPTRRSSVASVSSSIAPHGTSSFSFSPSPPGIHNHTYRNELNSRASLVSVSNTPQYDKNSNTNLASSSTATAEAEGGAKRRVAVEDLARVLSAVGLSYDFETLFSGVDPRFDGETVTSRMFRWAAGSEDPEVVQRFASMGGEETLSGTITADNLIAKCETLGLPPEFVSSFIQEVDANGDGVVDYGEFLAMILRNRHQTMGKTKALQRSWSHSNGMMMQSTMSKKQHDRSTTKQQQHQEVDNLNKGDDAARKSAKSACGAARGSVVVAETEDGTIDLALLAVSTLGSSDKKKKKKTKASIINQEGNPSLRDVGLSEKELTSQTVQGEVSDLRLANKSSNKSSTIDNSKATAMKKRRKSSVNAETLQLMVAARLAEEETEREEELGSIQYVGGLKRTLSSRRGANGTKKRTHRHPLNETQSDSNQVAAAGAPSQQRVVKDEESEEDDEEGEEDDEDDDSGDEAAAAAASAQAALVAAHQAETKKKAEAEAAQQERLARREARRALRLRIKAKAAEERRHQRLLKKEMDRAERQRRRGSAVTVEGGVGVALSSYNTTLRDTMDRDLSGEGGDGEEDYDEDEEDAGLNATRAGRRRGTLAGTTNSLSTNFGFGSTDKSGGGSGKRGRRSLGRNVEDGGVVPSPLYGDDERLVEKPRTTDRQDRLLVFEDEPDATRAQEEADDALERALAAVGSMHSRHWTAEGDLIDDDYSSDSTSASGTDENDNISSEDLSSSGDDHVSFYTDSSADELEAGVAERKHQVEMKKVEFTERRRLLHRKESAMALRQLVDEKERSLTAAKMTSALLLLGDEDETTTAKGRLSSKNNIIGGVIKNGNRRSPSPANSPKSVASEAPWRGTSSKSAADAVSRGGEGGGVGSGDGDEDFLSSSDPLTLEKRLLLKKHASSQQHHLLNLNSALDLAKNKKSIGSSAAEPYLNIPLSISRGTSAVNLNSTSASAHIIDEMTSTTAAAVGMSRHGSLAGWTHPHSHHGHGGDLANQQGFGDTTRTRSLSFSKGGVGSFALFNNTNSKSGLVGGASGVDLLLLAGGDTAAAGEGMSSAAAAIAAAGTTTVGEMIANRTDALCKKLTDHLSAHRAKVDAVVSKQLAASATRKNVILTDDGPFLVKKTEKAAREREQLRLMRQNNLKAPATSPRLFALKSTVVRQLEQYAEEEAAKLEEEIKSFNLLGLSSKALISRKGEGEKQEEGGRSGLIKDTMYRPSAAENSVDQTRGAQETYVLRTAVSPSVAAHSSSQSFKPRAHVRSPYNKAAFADPPPIPCSHPKHTDKIFEMYLSSAAAKGGASDDRDDDHVSTYGDIVTREGNAAATADTRKSAADVRFSRPSPARPYLPTRGPSAASLSVRSTNTPGRDGAPYVGKPTATGAMEEEEKRENERSPRSSRKGDATEQFYALGSVEDQTEVTVTPIIQSDVAQPASKCHRRGFSSNAFPSSSPPSSVGMSSSSAATRIALQRIVQSHLSLKLPAADSAFLRANHTIEKALEEVRRIYDLPTATMGPPFGAMDEMINNDQGEEMMMMTGANATYVGGTHTSQQQQQQRPNSAKTFSRPHSRSTKHNTKNVGPQQKGSGNGWHAEGAPMSRSVSFGGHTRGGHQSGPTPQPPQSFSSSSSHLSSHKVGLPPSHSNDQPRRPQTATVGGRHPRRPMSASSSSVVPRPPAASHHRQHEQQQQQLDGHHTGGGGGGGGGGEFSNGDRERERGGAKHKAYGRDGNDNAGGDNSATCTTNRRPVPQRPSTASCVGGRRSYFTAIIGGSTSGTNAASSTTTTTTNATCTAASTATRDEAGNLEAKVGTTTSTDEPPATKKVEKIQKGGGVITEESADFVGKSNNKKELMTPSSRNMVNSSSAALDNIKIDDTEEEEESRTVTKEPRVVNKKEEEEEGGLGQQLFKKDATNSKETPEGEEKGRLCKPSESTATVKTATNGKIGRVEDEGIVTTGAGVHPQTEVRVVSPTTPLGTTLGTVAAPTSRPPTAPRSRPAAASGLTLPPTRTPSPPPIISAGYFSLTQTQQHQHQPQPHQTQLLGPQKAQQVLVTNGGVSSRSSAASSPTLLANITTCPPFITPSAPPPPPPMSASEAYEDEIFEDDDDDDDDGDDETDIANAYYGDIREDISYGEDYTAFGKSKGGGGGGAGDKVKEEENGGDEEDAICIDPFDAAIEQLRLSRNYSNNNAGGEQSSRGGSSRPASAAGFVGGGTPTSGGGGIGMGTSRPQRPESATRSRRSSLGY